METKKIKVGAKVPLIHFLSGKETNKFVRATILDVDGDPVSASPYLLPYIASGIYMAITRQSGIFIKGATYGSKR